MEIRSLTPEDLIGSLNEVEKKHAPAQLFAAGDVGMLGSATRVSIVGSRKATPEGVRRARRLVGILCDREVVIVSGLAEGIDTAAHQAAIEVGGRTVGVIGTPMDKAYPRSNAALQAQMMEEQLVVSQFRLGLPVHRGNFPMRNRTMALLSDATVIIEAGETSGSLSQGWEALRLGRPLFIAQSIVENGDLSWPQEMLGYGAFILTAEAIEELFDVLPVRSVPESCDAVAF